MSYTVETLHGIFEIVQQMDYGEIIIAIILIVIAIIQGLKFIWEVAKWEGWL